MEKTIKELLEFSIINLDKPTGPTSFTVSQKVKDLFSATKSSHLGTLDPGVTGVLPVALNRACRLNEFLMRKNKTYVGIMHLHKEVSDKELNSQITKFIGEITQTPPVRSNVARKPRQRIVFNFDILEREEKFILFKTEVEAGTYIRTLIHDLGSNLGGANMLELRRTDAGQFSETDKNFISLYQLETAINEYKTGNETKLREILIPAEEVIKNVLPSVQIKFSSLKPLLTGKPLIEEDLISSLPDSDVFSLFLKDRFIAIVERTYEDDIIARPLFVLN